MPRSPRIDRIGDWKHLTNRGTSKRTVFETREDVRYFLSLVARAVRAGLIEVHAYCVLPNHFHLLVRSPRGEIARAMFLIENGYVRWFNRRRKRDGPLLRGRYHDAYVATRAHWEAAVEYIDRNPVEAGLCRAVGDYPYCSSYHFLGSRSPKWLVDGEAADLTRELAADTAARPDFEHLEGLVRSRLSRRRQDRDPLCDLVRASARPGRDWMIRKANLADGTSPGVRIADPATIRDLVATRREADPGRRLKLGRKSQDIWTLLEAGLLREAAGLGIAEIARRVSHPYSTVRTRTMLHRRALGESSDYATLAAQVATEAIRIDFAFVRGRRGRPPGWVGPGES